MSVLNLPLTLAGNPGLCLRRQRCGCENMAERKAAMVAQEQAIMEESTTSSVGVGISSGLMSSRLNPPVAVPTVPSVPVGVTVSEEVAVGGTQSDPERGAARMPQPGDVQDVEMQDADVPMDGEDGQMDIDMAVIAGLTTEPETTQTKVMYPIYIPRDSEPERDGLSFLGKKVYLARPIAVWDEQLASELDLEKAVEGRSKELKAMDKLKMGEVFSEEEAKLRSREAGVRVIPCRWVISEKTMPDGSEGVRARCVVQEVANTGPASSLGLSSNTPSAESLRALLAMAGADDLCVCGLDVSTAFMFSPLPGKTRAIVKLPPDVSLHPDHYEPACLDLSQAMNGLRIAPQAWMQFATQILNGVGLKQCRTEPSIFAGSVWVPELKRKAKIYIILYVDDLLVMSREQAGCDVVLSALRKHLEVKVTGVIGTSQSGGGELRFLRRMIRRNAGDARLMVQIDPSYFEPEFTGDGWFAGMKGTQVPPDLVKIVDANETPLTDEASERYRNVLGRVAWWAQSRPDLLRYVSLLSQGQSQPTQGYEDGVRKFMKFLKTQTHQWNLFPTGVSYPPMQHAESVLAFSDASWGGCETTAKRSVTGGVFVWRGSVLKSISRIQTSTSLSSCEAELIAVTSVCQEGLGLRQLCAFLQDFEGPAHCLSCSDFLKVECDDNHCPLYTPLEVRIDSNPALDSVGRFAT